MKGFFGKILLVISSLFVSLILIELSLFAIGYYNIALQDGSNRIAPEDEKSFRILAIGESTTAEYWNSKPEMAWPGQLEKKLREKGGKFRVYNQGRGATSSSYILKNLPHWIDTYRPHMVIGMVGINDHLPMDYLHQEEYWWSQLRIVKFTKWYIQSLKATPWPSPEEIEKLAIDFPIPKNVSEVQAFRKNVEAFARQSSHEWFVLRHVSHQIMSLVLIKREPMENHLKHELVSVGYQWALKAFHAQPRDNILFQKVGWFARFRNDHESLLKNLDFAIKNGLEPDPSFLQFFPKNNEKINQRLKTWGLGFRHGESGYDVLIRNYRKIADLLIAKNIDLVVMGYPTMTLDPFKNIFTENPERISYLLDPLKLRDPFLLKPHYRNLSWVSNENFNELLKKKDRDYYFYDNFTFMWGFGVGHATPEGHRAIVENILVSIKFETSSPGDQTSK